jgi:hypothetical protein
MGGEISSHSLLVGMQFSSATLEIGMEALQKIKYRPSYDPVITLLGIYKNKFNSSDYRGTCIWHYSQ